jgi:tetratricopeptide (TPR) repeat protein
VRCGCTKQDAEIYHQTARIFAEGKLRGKAIQALDWGLYLDAEQRDLLADHLILSDEDDSNIIDDTIQRVGTRSWDAASRVGVSFWKQKKYLLAIVVFQRLTKINPNAATAWYNLAINYQAASEPGLAQQAFDHAVGLDPGVNPEVDSRINSSIEGGQ